MHSFLKGVRRTGNISTNRHPGMRALTLVAYPSLADTPAKGMSVIPHSVEPEAREEVRQTAPLGHELPATPATAAVVSWSRNTAPLCQHSVPLPAQTASTAPLAALVTEGAREMAQHGVNAVFKAMLWATDQKIMGQMERRNRVVFLLLDGRRSIRDIAHLVHRDELDIARTLVRLLKNGYIEPVELPL